MPAAVKKTQTTSSPEKKTKRPGRKKNSKRRKRMPLWLRNVLLMLIIIFFSCIGYYFFIRPYRYLWRGCNGEMAYNVCIPCCYDVHGIDISHHQGRVNWSQLAANRLQKFPIEFIFIKATEGGDHIDTAFQYNFQKAREHNFIRGAYHFFSSKTDPTLQAQNFIENVSLETGDLPPVLDVEEARHSAYAELQERVLVWLDIVEGHYGVKPIIYTSYHFKNRHLNDAVFDDYPYWIAHYYVDSLKYTGKWSFWQHTDRSTIPGIRTDVDMNVFNGTAEDLKQMTIK